MSSLRTIFIRHAPAPAAVFSSSNDDLPRTASIEETRFVVDLEDVGRLRNVIDSCHFDTGYKPEFLLVDVALYLAAFAYCRERRERVKETIVVVDTGHRSGVELDGVRIIPAVSNRGVAVPVDVLPFPSAIAAEERGR